jgi:hypothetical protein
MDVLDISVDRIIAYDTTVRIIEGLLVQVLGLFSSSLWMVGKTDDLKVKKLNLSRNRPWRPIGLWELEDPTFSRQ